MSWWNVVKMVRTNKKTPEQHMEGKAFVVKDDIWLKAGGRKWGSETDTGWRYMDIEDIEETIGRRLTYDDFRIHYRNGLAPNPVLIDRLGGPAKQDQMLREAYFDIIERGMSGSKIPIEPFIEFLSRKPDHSLTPMILTIVNQIYGVSEEEIPNLIERYKNENDVRD